MGGRVAHGLSRSREHRLAGPYLDWSARPIGADDAAQYERHLITGDYMMREITLK